MPAGVHEHERAQPCAFEQYPGAASASLPPTYRPRRPQQTALHRVVREHLLTFLAGGIERSHSIVDAALSAAMQTRTVSRCALREPANDEEAEATNADWGA